MTASDDLDYSTDDDSTRIFYSETDGSGGATSCSQPCSRRSSYGGPCSLPCSRRSSFGLSSAAPGGGCCCCCSNGPTSSPPTASAAGCCCNSRRSSNSSHAANLSSADEGCGVQTAFNRVMSSNHRAVTRPRDVKFKRINKAKSRSLEELRGKLKWQAPVLVALDEDKDDVGKIQTARKRGRFQQCASLDHHSEA
jgi:hypothetical protein